MSMLAAFMDAMDDRTRVPRRLVAGVVVAVLALGGIAAMWVASRGDVAPPVTAYAPPRVPTVWPESGLEGQETARIVQYRADNQDRDVSWRRSPAKVVHAFVASVLGWSEPDVRPQYPGLDTSRVWYTVRDLPCSSPCEVFGVVPTLDIEVVQPARRGEGGIWSVAIVRSAGLRIRADAGDPPRSDAIPGLAGKAAGLRTLAGAQWYDGCTGGHDIVDGIRRPSRFEITLPDPVTAAPPGCSSVAAGYAYAYSVPRLTQPVGDPLLESAPLTDLTIVPIRVLVAGQTPPTSGLVEQVEPVAPKLPRVPWTPFEDPLGWSIAYPPGWGHSRLEDPGMTGIVLSNDPDAKVRTNGPQHDVLVLQIRHFSPEERPPPIPADDSELPISLDDFVVHANATGTRSPAYGFTTIRLGGYRLDISVVFGRSMDPSTMRELDRVLGTIRFVPLAPGYRYGERERLMVLRFAEPPLRSAVIDEVGKGVDMMVVHAPGGLYALKLDSASYPDVSKWDWDATARQVVYGDVRWNWDGVPLDLVSVDPLPTFAVARGWDGHLLVKTKGIALNPGYRP